MSDFDGYRKQAEECRELAATVYLPEEKAFWLRLAEDWMRVAALVRERDPLN